MALRSRAPLPVPAAPTRASEPEPDAPRPPLKPSRGRASTREGKRAMQVWLAPEAVLQMNYLALDEDTTVQALMEEAVEALFRAKGKARLRG